MSTTLDCKDIGIRKSEFVTETQFLLVGGQFDMKKVVQTCIIYSAYYDCKTNDY